MGQEVRQTPAIVSDLPDATLVHRTSKIRVRNIAHPTAEGRDGHVEIEPQTVEVCIRWGFERRWRIRTEGGRTRI
jgi:hypothetical protein